MGETASQPFHESPTRILVGEGKPVPALKKEQTQGEASYNKHMREIFDVVAPEAVAERVEAAKAQSEIAVETASLLKDKSNAWQRYKDHKDFNRFVKELDTEWRGRELPHRLERVLMYSILGGASAAMDYVADEAALQTFLKYQGDVNIGKKKLFTLDDNNGNREAIKAGWEMLSDELVGAFSDKSLQLATNNKDATFVSPLSNSLSKIGTIFIAIAGISEDHRYLRSINSIINPSTIEAGFRTLETIPLGGAVVERMHAALNTVISKDHHILPLGFDLAVAVTAAKMKKVNDIRHHPPAVTNP